MGCHFSIKSLFLVRFNATNFTNLCAVNRGLLFHPSRELPELKFGDPEETWKIFRLLLVLCLIFVLGSFGTSQNKATSKVSLYEFII